MSLYIECERGSDMAYLNLSPYLQVLIANFENFLRVDVRLENSTIETYRPKVENFLSWCVVNYTAEPVTEITQEYVKLYLECCQNKEIGRPAFKAARPALERFFHYLKIAKKIKINPMDGLYGPGG